MRLYVIGSEGQVARSLREAAALDKNIVFGYGARPEVDLLQPSSIEKALADFRPDVVINPAAYTAVDRAETEPDQSFAINRDGARAAAAAAAQQANGAAADAKNAATAANTAANTVGTKLDTFDKASRRLVYEVVLSEDQGNFKFGKADLPDEVKAKIDEMVTNLKADPKNVFIEIEGHTDNVGGKETNYDIGMKRAEAVKEYLYTQHQIPLHKINVISYGEDKPVAPNNTRAGRAMNRRVVVRVLS